MTGNVASWRVDRAILGESAECGKMRAGFTAYSEIEVLKAGMKRKWGWRMPVWREKGVRHGFTGKSRVSHLHHLNMAAWGKRLIG
jgi:hypothetical protein